VMLLESSLEPIGCDIDYDIFQRIKTILGLGIASCTVYSPLEKLRSKGNT